MECERKKIHRKKNESAPQVQIISKDGILLTGEMRVKQQRQKERVEEV